MSDAPKCKEFSGDVNDISEGVTSTVLKDCSKNPNELSPSPDGDSRKYVNCSKVPPFASSPCFKSSWTDCWENFKAPEGYVEDDERYTVRPLVRGVFGRCMCDEVVDDGTRRRALCEAPCCPDYTLEGYDDEGKEIDRSCNSKQFEMIDEEPVYEGGMCFQRFRNWCWKKTEKIEGFRQLGYKGTEYYGYGSNRGGEKPSCTCDSHKEKREAAEALYAKNQKYRGGMEFMEMRDFLKAQAQREVVTFRMPVKKPLSDIEEGEEPATNEAPAEEPAPEEETAEEVPEETQETPEEVKKRECEKICKTEKEEEKAEAEEKTPVDEKKEKCKAKRAAEENFGK